MCHSPVGLEYSITLPPEAGRVPDTATSIGNNTSYLLIFVRYIGLRVDALFRHVYVQLTATAGKHYGASGSKIGNVHLRRAFGEVACLSLAHSALVAAHAWYTILHRKIIWTFATELIAGHGKVDLARIGQIHNIHDLDKLLLRLSLTQARVTRLFLPDGSNATTLVIVAGIYQRLVRQNKEFLVNAVVQGCRIAGLEIRATAGVNQQGVTAEQQLVCAVVDKVGVMMAGVARRKQRVQQDIANAKRLALPDTDIGTGQFVNGRKYHEATGQFAQTSRAREVVSMNMGVDCVVKLQTHRLQDGHIALCGSQNRVDQCRFTAVRTTDQIGIRARVGVE